MSISSSRSKKIRKLRNKLNPKSSSITYSESEPFALCYYLYVMFEDKSNISVMEKFESSIMLFLDNVKALNKTARLNKILNFQIMNLEKNNLLTPLKEISEEMEFDGSKTAYKYSEDKKIEREISRHFDKVDETLINLCRVLYASEKNIFSSIVNSTVFKNSNDYSLSSELSITKQMEKKVFDISKVQFLVDQVNLSEEEARFILFKCRQETNEYLHDTFRSADRYTGEGFYSCVADLIGVSDSELRYMLRSDQKLRTFEFIDDDMDYNDSLNDCIEAQSIEPYFKDILKPLDCKNAYKVNSYSQDKENIDISINLLKGNNPVSILFYGKPGSGKTELAKTLGKQSGKNVYIFKNEAECEKDNKVLGKLSCLLSMERNDSIIIVDEADTILKTRDISFFGTTPSHTKGIVNKMLENNKNQVIYIINHKILIDESTLRRFTFSIKFEAMPPKMLHAIAETKIGPMKISDETKEKLLSLLDRYKLSGSSAENLVKTLECIDCSNEESLLEKAQILMKENSLLLYGKTKMRESVKAEYDLSVLNSSVDPERLVKMIQNAESFAEKHKEGEKGIRMLFYGLSGTGKTELVRYIADKVGKPILLKRASDLLSCYVGGTEKNIADAFEEAEHTGSLLLIDEADSFFQDRANAQRSWEITQVNEFLTQMEEFSGILICTTNLRKIMDPAMQRRFHVLAEFKALTHDGIEKLCKRFFPDLSFTEEQISMLEKYNSVTPGDFASLKARYRFMDEAEQNTAKMTEELEILQKEKKKNINADLPIGFTA